MRLMGISGVGEHGLLVNRGSVARSEVEFKRTRAKLRLIKGEQLVDLLFAALRQTGPALSLGPDLPPGRPSFTTRILGVLLCCPTCPRPLSEFPPFDQVQGLVSCIDFISPAGTLCPIALSGLSSL